MKNTELTKVKLFLENKLAEKRELLLILKSFTSTPESDEKINDVKTNIVTLEEAVNSINKLIN